LSRFEYELLVLFHTSFSYTFRLGSVHLDLLAFTRSLAVGYRMFLGMQAFDFALV